MKLLARVLAGVWVEERDIADPPGSCIVIPSIAQSPRTPLITVPEIAVTVIFFAMVISEDTAARLDMLRRGLTVGALIAATDPVAVVALVVGLGLALRIAHKPTLANRLQVKARGFVAGRH